MNPKPRTQKRHSSDKEANERRINRLIAEISDPNRKDAELFLILKAGSGVKSSSRENYARALQRLDATSHGRPWLEVNEADAAQLMADMRHQFYSDDNLRTTASCLKHFLRFIRNDGELPFRLVLAFQVKGNRHLPDRPVLTRQEEDLLMTAAPTIRDQVIVAMLTEGGFRAGELTWLDVESVNLDDKGGAWIRMPNDIEEGLKTGPRPVYICRYRPLLEAYLSTHPARGDPKAALLYPYDYRRQPRQGGLRLGIQGLWTALNRLQRKTGLRRFRMHDLRHTAITRASENGMNLQDLSERFWGNKNTRQIARYTHHSQEHKERQARIAAGVDPDGHPVHAEGDAQRKLQQLRKLWAEVMGTPLPGSPNARARD